ARAATAPEARERGRSHRDGPRGRLSLPAPRLGASPPRVRLATRLFVTTSLLAALAVAGLAVAADRLLRRYLEDEIAHGLEREALLIAALLPADSLRWPDFARRLGASVGHRVTLIDPTGKVRGDTEFDRASLGGLENHLARPEVQQALASGEGRGTRWRAASQPRHRRRTAARVPGRARPRGRPARRGPPRHARAARRALRRAGPRA